MRVLILVFIRSVLNRRMVTSLKLPLLGCGNWCEVTK